MKIRLKIIETRKCIIAVSEEMKIRVGDYYLSNGDIIYKATSLTDLEKLNRPNRTVKRILGYMPKTDCVSLVGVPYLPEITVEDDVEKLVENLYQIETGNWQMNSITSEKRRAYIEGYKAATKIFSEEDLRKVIVMARKGKLYQVSESVVNIDGLYTSDEIIQSLKQPKTPKWFVADVYETKKSDDPFTSIDVLIKLVRKDGNSVIINGSQAYELSGSYEY